jgi:hypothetical protein
MNESLSEEEAVHRFAAATLGLLKTFRTADNSRLVAEIRRIAKEAHESEVTSFQNQQAAKPMLLNARQAAKSLSISERTLHSMTAPRGPIPAVKIGTRVCYAVSDLERAVDALKVKPSTARDRPPATHVSLQTSDQSARSRTR